MRITPSDLSSLTFVAIQAALKAGDILRRGFGTIYEITAKPGRQNIVTEYDKAAEIAIISLIQEHFPDHSFLGEESGLTKSLQETVHWIIDPLDGTTNFARHLPIFTISIGAYEGNIGLSSVIFQPFTNELFVAEKGKGAYLNGIRLSVSLIDQMEEAVIGAGFPYQFEDHPKDALDHLSRFTRMGAILRNLGSAALMLAYVAAGKLDGFWMDNLYPWDLAAGKLLIEESGGLITQYNGKPHIMTKPSTVVAGNPQIYHNMLAFLQS